LTTFFSSYKGMGQTIGTINKLKTKSSFDA
jgi:hypothetical protein